MSVNHYNLKYLDLASAWSGFLEPVKFSILVFLCIFWRESCRDEAQLIYFLAQKSERRGPIDIFLVFFGRKVTETRPN